MKTERRATTRAAAGYSGTPLVRKLGIRPGMAVRLFHAPADYWTLLGGDAGALDVAELSPRGRRPADFQHVFATTARSLDAALATARSRMVVDGMIWVSWPKQSAGVPTEIGRSDVMAAGKLHGLVDVKVCAVDETWSGLKFVIPLKDRK